MFYQGAGGVEAENVGHGLSQNARPQAQRQEVQGSSAEV